MVELDDNDDETALDSLPRVLSVMPDDNFDCSASPDDDDEVVIAAVPPLAVLPIAVTALLPTVNEKPKLASPDDPILPVSGPSAAAPP